MADNNTNGMWSGLGTASVSGGIGGLLGLAGNALNYRYNKKLAQLQQDFNVQNAAQAQNYALAQQEHSASLSYQNWLKQFEAQNEQQKNLLLHQKSMEVQAMRNAGLNPALAGGAVASVSVPGTSAPAPSGSGPLAQAGLAHAQGESLASGFASGVQAGSAASLIPSQKAVLTSQATKNIADAKSTDAFRDPTVKKLASETSRNLADADRLQAEAEYRRIMTPLDAAKIISETKLLDASTKEKLDKLPAELKLLNAQALETIQRTATEKAEESLYRAKVDTEKSTQAYNYAAASNQRAQASYAVALTEQAYKYTKLLSTQIAKTKAEWALVEKEIIKAGAEGKLADYMARYKTTFSPEVQRWIDFCQGAFDNLLKLSGTASEGFENFMNGASKAAGAGLIAP